MDSNNFALSRCWSRITIIPLCLTLSLSSCLGLRGGRGTTATPAGQNQTKARGWALMYPELMNDSSSGGTQSSADGTMGFTAPSNSTAPGMFDFSGIFAESRTAAGGLPWHVSITEALAEARQQGKLMLILITHRDSKPAQELENTLVLNPQFRELVNEKITLLRVDYFNTETRRSPLYQNLKEKLKARGYPTLVLSLPDSTELLRLSGYKTEYQESYLRQLASAVQESSKAVEKRRQQLAAQGYRQWQSKEGREVFAKLIQLDANKATFLGEWGNEFTSFTNRLSAADQDWIEMRRTQAAASAASRNN